MNAQHTPGPWTFVRSMPTRRTYFVRRWVNANPGEAEYVTNRSGRPKLYRTQEAAASACAALNAATPLATVPQDEFAGIARQRMQREFERTDRIVAAIAKSSGEQA